jgi:hypothetical protein
MELRKRKACEADVPLAAKVKKAALDVLHGRHRGSCRS